LANTKTPYEVVSIILPDVLENNIKTSILEEIHEDSTTYDPELDNFYVVRHDEELHWDRHLDRV